ncbi:MAG: hypothetical protein HKN92_08445 [Chitinophagales bacterium]|nr:hypothetical protein [Chitinophagales bacterium]
MIWIFKIAAFALAFLTMEFIAWFTHKYVMHGFLWILHKSHHQKGKSFFEWNDFFFLFFGSIGAILIFTGLPEFDFRLFIGAGITAYGITYICLHDILIHKRLKLFNKPEHTYFKAMMKAHRAHHGNIYKEDGEAFGLLWFDRKFFKNNRK